MIKLEKKATANLEKKTSKTKKILLSGCLGCFGIFILFAALIGSCAGAGKSKTGPTTKTETINQQGVNLKKETPTPSKGINLKKKESTKTDEIDLKKKESTTSDGTGDLLKKKEPTKKKERSGRSRSSRRR